MLISTGNLQPDSLAGQVVVITGAGRGIGYEAARALAWLGANVLIAEIDRIAGKDAARKINMEIGGKRVYFIQTDVGDTKSVRNLAKKTLHTHGKVDIVIHNATITPLGAVKDVPVRKWDQSYAVNLRGPVLLTQAFLPGMLERDYGVLVSVSSTGLAYMGAYEIFKAAQVNLANTLDAELEGTGVITFTIGPGMAPTQTALTAIEKLAPLMGQSVETFHEIIKDQTISVEAAGAGFAAAVALAENFRGQEIASVQALTAAGISWQAANPPTSEIHLTSEQIRLAVDILRRVMTTYDEQSSDWKNRHLFERQWLYRTFKKHTNLTVEQMAEYLKKLENALRDGELQNIPGGFGPLAGLQNYYAYMAEMAKGYVKDPQVMEEQVGIVNSWVDEVRQLREIFSGEELEKA